MARYRVTEAAQSDIEEIVDRIASDDVALAIRFEDEVYAAFDLLAERPAIGHRRSDLTDRPVLFWPVMRHAFAIIYTTSEPVTIIRVARWRRITAAFLTGEG